MIDSTRSTSVQLPPAALAATSPPEVRLWHVRVDRVRDEMAQLGIDEKTLAFWGKMSPRLVEAVLTSGQANRATLRRLRRALRWAWTDKVGVPDDVKHWARLRLGYLSDELA